MPVGLLLVLFQKYGLNRIIRIGLQADVHGAPMNISKEISAISAACSVHFSHTCKDRMLTQEDRMLTQDVTVKGCPLQEHCASLSLLTHKFVLNPSND